MLTDDICHMSIKIIIHVTQLNSNHVCHVLKQRSYDLKNIFMKLNVHLEVREFSLTRSRITLRAVVCNSAPFPGPHVQGPN